MVTLPTYTVEVAWTGNLTGVFRVGISTVGGTDVLGSPFSGNVFNDITSDVYAFKTTRGRSDDLGEVEQGTATINLRDYSGKYNYENTSSSLYGYTRPMRPIRIRATHLGTTYGVFQGYIDRIEYDQITRESVIECVDTFEIMNVPIEGTVTYTATTAGGIIGELLDALQFTEPALRSLDAGRSFSVPAPATSGTYLERIGDAVESDRGVFFITRSGVARYIAGENHWARSSPVASLTGDVNSDLRVSVDKQRIVNRIVVTSVTDTDFTATNAFSRQTYGFRSGQPVDPVLGITNTEAANLATWLVNAHGAPTVPARSITLKASDDTNVGYMLSLDIGNRVAFSEPRGNTNAQGTIEGINHTVEVGTLHTTQILVSKRTIDAFTVGFSQLGGEDLLYW